LRRAVKASLDTLSADAARTAVAKLAVDTETALYDTKICLGRLWCVMHRREDALTVYQETLGEVRDIISHENTANLQRILSTIMFSIAEIRLLEFDSQCYNGDEGDSKKCIEAIALLKEALVIQRSLSLAGTTRTQLQLIRAYTHVEMLDKGLSACVECLRELNLNRRVHGDEINQHVAACHQHMAVITGKKAEILRDEISAHETYFLTNTTKRVIVAGLQNKPLFNGRKGVIMNASRGVAVDPQTGRMRVILDGSSKKELSLKPENVRPLIPTEQRQSLFRKIRDLTHQQIASSKEFQRVQLMLRGAKHVQMAGVYHTLGQAYLQTYTPADTRTAVEMMHKATRILRRVDDGDEHKLAVACGVSSATEALARFDEAGVLSAMPCVWLETSRQEDEGKMAKLFAGLKLRNGTSGSPTMASERMQQGLREFGLFDFHSPTSLPVDVAGFVAMACDELEKMKLKANCDVA